MTDEFDEFATEVDLLAVAEAVGVVKDVPAEKSAAERWAEPIPGHVPYDDDRVTRVRRAARRFEAETNRIGSPGGFNGDPDDDRRRFVGWLIDRLTAVEYRDRKTA